MNPKSKLNKEAIMLRESLKGTQCELARVKESSEVCAEQLIAVRKERSQLEVCVTDLTTENNTLKEVIKRLMP